MLEGLRSVPDEVRESATGLGYGRRRLLFRIELPLALPVMMAGLRVATVSTVALTTVGSLVAYGGLGNLIKDGVSTNFRAELLTAVRALRGARRRCSTSLHRAGPAAPDAVDPGGARMNVLSDAWAYLTDGANWTGTGGMLQLLVQQLLLTVTALALALAIGLPIALWLGHLGRGGFLAINISNVGRAVPTFALLALLVVAELARAPAVVRPLRPRRPGDPDRADAVRAAADHHQRLRRRARGAAPTSASRRAAWG